MSSKKKAKRTMTPDERDALMGKAFAHILNTIEWDCTGWDGLIENGDITYGEFLWLRQHLPGNLEITASLPAKTPLAVTTDEDDGDED